ncbi:methyltransferase [Phreatobacter sp.]|uniref:methyltransferase n=1 Tax=Phreatobacter sp. TaxID=1966341 RepID=UPI003F720DCE
MTSLAPSVNNRPETWPDRVSGRWRNWRNRLVANPRFQRFAATFPLTRPTARRHASGLFDLCAGFVYSQVLFACARLRLFDHLAGGPVTHDELGHRLGLPPEGAARLVKAAAALGLVELQNGEVSLGLRGAALRGNPGALAMIEHHAMLYADLADPVALLQGRGAPSQLSRFWAYGGNGGGGEATAAYTALMAASQPLIADDILDAYPVSGHKVILDIGGGDGTFLRHVHRRAPGARLILFDLPPVAALAASRPDRPASLSVVAGHFLHDPVPEGADLVTLVRVAHDHDDDVLQKLFRRIHGAMAPGGTLLIAEPMAQSASLAPMADAYFGFYLMAMGSGQARSPDTLGALLAAAGFHQVRQHPTRRPLFAGLMSARRADQT